MVFLGNNWKNPQNLSGKNSLKRMDKEYFGLQNYEKKI